MKGGCRKSYCCKNIFQNGKKFHTNVKLKKYFVQGLHKGNVIISKHIVDVKDKNVVFLNMLAKKLIKHKCKIHRAVCRRRIVNKCYKKNKF